MDPLPPFATSLRWLFRGLRRVGVGPALGDAELAGASYLLASGLLGALWDRRQRAPDWEALSRGWEDEVARRGAVDPTLYGAFAAGDRVELLADNAGAFRVRDRLLAEARHSIDVATYYLQDDATGRATVDALRAAMSRGVRVRVIADEAITIKKEVEGLGARRALRELADAGAAVRLWRDHARPYDGWHRKLLVVDARAVVIGGRNYADHYAGPDWRDLELHLEGPSAAGAAAVFQRSFDGAPEPRGEAGRLFQATAPSEIRTHANFLFLLACVGAARREIAIENAYYFDHAAVRRALAAAVRRGVRVRVFTNSAESNDLDFANWRLLRGFPDLLEAGVELYLRRGRGRTLHAKYFVVDRAWLSLGSSNLDYYSPRHCTDCNVQAHSPELGARLADHFAAGVADAERVTDPAPIHAELARLRVSRVLDTVVRDQQ